MNYTNKIMKLFLIGMLLLLFIDFNFVESESNQVTSNLLHSELKRNLVGDDTVDDYNDDNDDYGTVTDPKDFHRFFYLSIIDPNSILRYGVYVECGIFGVLTIIQICKQQVGIGQIKLAMIYFLWLVIEVIIVSARANFMLRKGSDYEAYILKDDSLVYFKESLRDLTPESRKQVGCDYKLEGAVPAADDVCSYWFLDLDADLVTQGWVKFSLGIGLIINIILRFVAITIKLAYDLREKDDQVADNFCLDKFTEFWSWIIITIIELLLHFQQFIVLLPLQVVLPNEYCLDIQVPVDTKKAVCEYKLACTGVPIGLPMAAGGLFFAYFFGGIGASTEEAFVTCFFFFLALGSALIGFFGLTMIIFWLFAGIILGFWYIFGGYSLGYLTSEINVMIVFLSSLTVILFFLESVICYCMRPRTEYRKDVFSSFIEMVGTTVLPK